MAHGNSSLIGLGETGPVSYSVKVFAGTYDVYAESGNSSGQSVLPHAQETKVRTGCKK
jgi:hypothetical protein